MCPEYGADGAGMCWSLKNKKKHGEIFKKHIGDISYIQFSIWKSSRYLIASAGHLSKLP
jgi:hypothetical protein